MMMLQMSAMEVLEVLASKKLEVLPDDFERKRLNEGLCSYCK